MGASNARGFLAVAGDDPHPLVELLSNILGRAGLEKRDPIVAAGGKYPLACFAHLGGIRLARHRDIAQRKAKIARPQFGKAETGNCEDRLAIGDALRGFELDAEQRNSPAGSSGQGSQRWMYFSVEIPQIGAAVVSEPRPRVPIPSPLQSALRTDPRIRSTGEGRAGSTPAL
jgi:hypothetical protein